MLSNKKKIVPDDSPKDLILRNSNQKEEGFVCCTPRCYLLLAAVMASLGGVLFGYDVGRLNYE